MDAASSKSAIRVACLASANQFRRNPLSSATNEPLIFCANKDKNKQLIEMAVDVFSEKGFDVTVAQPKQESTFAELLKVQGKESVCETLKEVKEHDSEDLSKAVWSVVKEFSQMDKNLEQAKQQPYAANRVLAQEEIENYAEDVAKNERLLRVLKKQRPELYKRIELILENDRAIEL